MSEPGSGDSRRITVDLLTRVEGEGALTLRTRGGELESCELRIFEPPRFFEAFLVGRHWTEAPDITARICGICPVAYQMSACHAMEAMAGVRIDGPLRDLRRLLYCGEWIESHGLHVGMLQLPDFLGYPDAIAMARDHPELVRTTLRLKQTGNRVMRTLGGREIHPVNVRLGGFYRLPARADLQALVPELEWALDAARGLAERIAELEFPDFHQDYELVALVHPDEYPFNEGRLVSTAGIDVPVGRYDEVLVEHQSPHSTALHTATARGTPVLMGPLARYALNHERLTPLARETAARIGLGAVVDNPFRAICVRLVEIVFACEEALRILRGTVSADQAAVPVPLRAGTGCGATEAPRGLCYHRYRVDADGLITEAKIVAPTSVNQARIEADLRALLAGELSRPDDELRFLCERAIRNYDPCISCATHFLDLRVERS
ncbi:MAG TPA: Ni/Fe hydrogenase subunit alpha [Gammaproteobacteria bacterium]|nr:Ni/Fe hydrogenase subunit alpha [Gammaproteobacteria bacterium]